MVRISRDYVIDCLKTGLEPAAFCESGDVVEFETRDCYDDNDITEEHPYGNHPDGLENPATGPLFVRGAEPGDVLKVEILQIELREYGIMRTSVTDGAFHHLYKEKTARRFCFRQDEPGGGYQISFDDKLTLDCDIMIGVIGTAPEGDGVLTITPGAHGGNMDCRKIGIGTTLYLPVNTPGALLAMGDLHALMGDGEMMICGLETGGTVTVRVTVLKESEAGYLKAALPLLEAEDNLMTIQSAETLDEAAKLAACRMQQLVARVTGLDDVNSGMLMSLQGNLVICQIVNPLKTVRCEFPKQILECYRS